MGQFPMVQSLTKILGGGFGTQFFIPRNNPQDCSAVDQEPWKTDDFCVPKSPPPRSEIVLRPRPIGTRVQGLIILLTSGPIRAQHPFMMFEQVPLSSLWTRICNLTV